MAGFTPFTDNYSDLSDQNGYQFEFRCDICGSGYRSEFQRSNLGTASNAAERREQPHRRPVGRVERGQHGPEPDRPRGARRGAEEGRRRDHAQVQAVSARPHVGRRDRAGTRSAGCASTTRPSWPRRWRPSAPRSRSARCARRCRATTQFLGDLSTRNTMCTSCGKPVGSAKFCPSCGTPVAMAKCANCGTDLAAGAKFCGSCGTPVAAA